MKIRPYKFWLIGSLIAIFSILCLFPAKIWFEWKQERDVITALGIYEGDYKFDLNASTEYQKLSDHLPASLQMYLERCKGVRLAGTVTTDSKLKQLSKLTKIKRLFLIKPSITDEGLQHLSSLSQLRGLDLRGTMVNDECITFLLSGTIDPQQLTLLLSKGQLSDEMIADIEKRGLTAQVDSRQLVIPLALGLPIPLPENNPNRISNRPKLNTVNLSNTKVTAEELKQISGLFGLKVLSLHNTKITDEELKHISGLTGLTKLYLSGTNITGEGLKYISKHSRLTKLSLAGTNISDEGLKHLSQLSRLEQLNLDNTQITDQELIRLSTLPQLRSLAIRKTRITDDGLKHLSQLSQLQSMFLNDTDITGEGILFLLSGTINPNSLRLDLDRGQLSETIMGDLKQRGVTIYEHYHEDPTKPTP